MNQASLFEVAQALELGDELLLGEGELKSGGFRRPSILADGFEALLGAVYLDAGFDAVREAGGERSSPAGSSRSREAPPAKDPKTALQENLQGRRLPLPRYTVVTRGRRGAPAGRSASSAAWTSWASPRVGEGGSRRAAEQQAAETVLARCWPRQRAGPS